MFERSLSLSVRAQKAERLAAQNLSHLFANDVHYDQRSKTLVGIRI